MKKLTIPAFIVFVLFSTAAFGQINSYGLKVGVQSAGVSSEHFENDRVTGLSFYGFADWDITNMFAATFDLGLTKRGFTTSQIETSPIGQYIQTVDATSRLSYISFASFANLLSPFSSVPLSLGVGSRFDLLINSEPGTYEFSDYTAEDDTAEELNNFVAGLSFVIGFRDLSIDNRNFRMEAKYEMDLTNSLSEDPMINYKNNVIMLVMGISL